MGFMHFESTLKPFISMCGMNGKNERRMDPKDQGNLQNIGSTPSQQLFFFFFLGSVMLYSKNDPQ
jgi:glutamine synthetase type III